MTKSLEEITAQADKLYNEREELERVRHSLEILKLAPDAYESLWRMGRARFFLGQEARDKSSAREHYLSGIDVSRRAARAFDKGVEGHFWLGVNLALLAELRNPALALAHALRAKRELERAVLLDKTYHAAGPPRVLARLESKLPRIFGGGMGRARTRFEEAIRIAPSNTVTRLYFAELLLEAGDTNRARTELETILTIPFDPIWGFEIKRDQARARKILQKQNSEFRTQESE